MRCPFPGCYLDEHEDGEHKLGRPEKPWGSLRLAQEFVTQGMRCDLRELSGHAWGICAEAFYIDMLGFGWALCSACAKQCQVPPVLYFQPKPEPQPKAVPAPQIQPRPDIWPGAPSPARSAKVLEFRKAGS